MEAPTNDPRTGKVAAATLESGPGAGPDSGEEIGPGPAPPAEGEVAGALAAMTALIEAAATMMAVEIFFMSEEKGWWGREAPTKDPRTGKVAAATLESGPGAAAEEREELGPEPPAEGAGAGTSAAITTLIEAAATMMALENFFMSMAYKGIIKRTGNERDLRLITGEWEAAGDYYLLCYCRSEEQ
ncbi:hypothetical protein CXB51_029272 [Gossypium anomalum]|uniref:Uncharacterized protein n=1 Tax=Gossypium anomalum TaxID=47600 RepID=A0A8J5YC56_9ROSI|nr:hypothetical protein CXB51_029272 [Gossypium anomalum]